MEKLQSQTHKQFLIRKVAVDLVTPEKTIEAVINHQFSSILDAMKTSHSVELSGFGKFLYNNKKAQRMKDKCNNQIRLFTEKIEDPITSPIVKRNAELKLLSAQDHLKRLISYDKA